MRELHVMARGAHRDAQGLPVDPQLEWLLHGEGVHPLHRPVRPEPEDPAPRREAAHQFRSLSGGSSRTTSDFDTGVFEPSATRPSGTSALVSGK